MHPDVARRLDDERRMSAIRRAVADLPRHERETLELGSTDGDCTNDLTTLQSWRLYRAHPEVAKVEARYVLNGTTGPWTNEVVDDGFAYIEVRANGKFTVGQKLKTEVRAFDAQGRQIPIG